MGAVREGGTATVAPAGAGPSGARRLDASMSLLVDLMTHAEDPAYAAAAQRDGDRPGARRRVRPTGLVLLLVVGLVTGVAGAAARAAADRGDSDRAGLVREVRSRSAASDALARQAAALRADVTARRDAVLASDAAGQAAAARLSALEVASATVAVQGPGVVVTISDRPASAAGGSGLPRGGQVGDGRVLDRDLQDLVNGLWLAGAEAVSIDDLRLTARTAIRSAGEAVLVDFRPVSPPYVVRAVGDPGRLLPAFVDGEAGRRLATYTQLYGLPFETHADQDLRLPAGSVPDPRSAVPGGAG